MAPNPNKMAEACKAVDFLGISEAIVKKKLRALLKLYDNNWELIAAEGYRVLADHLLEDNEQEDKPKKRKAALPLQIELPSELEAPLRTLRPRKKKRASDSLRQSKETEAKISLRKGKSALPSTSDTSQSSEEIPLIKRRSIHHKEQLSACNNSPAYEEEVAKPDMHAVCSVAPKIDPCLDIIPLEVIPDSDCCYYMDNVTKEAFTYEVEDQAGLEATNPGTFHLREELAALEAKIATKDDELRREKTAYKRADAILRQAVEAVTSIGGMNPPPQDRAQERVAAIEEQFNGIRAVVIPVAP
ncbi:hypothetical protein Tsubulata_039380 [Turnera subulata]|uniref:WIYLD domain-containing protein n=1 Tax=Turnera subulata TaxID=218843 RepID=A0A9Q0F1T1_9ROSI|nr:hypothetical protein Tsubulata_039380 [Turnera subulata]